MHNQYPLDKSLSSIFDPQTPSPPPMTPPYTELPDRNVNFHFAPLLNGKIGDIELETIDGKRFLVHRKILEAETVFFHIYYGFVPVWRLNAASSSSSSSDRNLSNDIVPSIHQSPSTTFRNSSLDNRVSISTNQSFQNLRSLPKIIAQTLSSRSSISQNSISENYNNVNINCSNNNENIEENSLPPPLPPKDIITSPTPTNSPYTWIVPENSNVLLAFLSLIYPKGIITKNSEDLLNPLEITSKVIKTSLGYQSSKALNISRDKLNYWIKEFPIEIYSLACFFKFKDLIKLSSIQALKINFKNWSEENKLLMGKKSLNDLLNLQSIRLNGLINILNIPPQINDEDFNEHFKYCHNKIEFENAWFKMIEIVKIHLNPDSDLLELLEIDLREFGQCGNCLVLLGKNIQRCLLQAKELPTSL
ncbi:uncharacterized protein I206_103285 [Kwoniella pini CBS 10737]|uniref:BTB domain-containing protein n=1 Tax=Kwoniella pini CBS 10737 TaxID=1296096 RepID=A0AAJ8L598_9TREE